MINKPLTIEQLTTVEKDAAGTTINVELWRCSTSLIIDDINVGVFFECDLKINCGAIEGNIIKGSFDIEFYNRDNIVFQSYFNNKQIDITLRTIDNTSYYRVSITSVKAGA